MSSSRSDRKDYRDFCRDAATDDERFARFRHHPACIAVIETVSPQDGAAYVNAAIGLDPSLPGRFDEVRRNDAVGAPVLCGYKQIGPFSPTTLRYAYTAADLNALFGALGGFDIVEVGGGYGGQCRILKALGASGAYTIVDLPETLALARRYLAAFGIDTVTFATPDQVPERAPDLVISNYAYSELSRDIQDLYFHRFVGRARHGYMMYNSRAFVDVATGYSYDVDEIAARIPHARTVPGGRHSIATDVNARVVLLHW